MKTRILSGLIMVPLLVFIILRGWVLFAGCFVLSLMAVREFYRGFKEMGIHASYPIAIGSTVLLYAFGLLGNIGVRNEELYYGGLQFFSSGIAIMIWMFLTVLACLLYLFKIEERKLEDGMATLVGIFYVVFFCYHLAELGMLEKSYSILVWLVVITAFGTDICAYFAGVTMGKHKLCPVISPKKTWEGAIGGVIGCMILCGIFAFFFVKGEIVFCLAVGLLGSVVSMFGDLTASIFKRKMGIKDYGNLIPGHGGIMDRFDSVLFTAPLVYYVLMVYLNLPIGQ